MEEAKGIYAVDALYVDGTGKNMQSLFYLNEKNGEINYSLITKKTFKRQEVDQIKNESINDLISFEEFLINNEFDILLYDYNLNYRQRLSRDEAIRIITAVERKNDKSEMTEYFYKKSEYISEVICDLLGLNINDFPNSDIKVMDRKDIIVKASQVVKFKKTLKTFIFAELLLLGKEETIIISNLKDNRDLKIQRSLKSAHIDIKRDDIGANEFRIKIKSDATIEISNCLIEEKNIGKKLKVINFS